MLHADYPKRLSDMIANPSFNIFYKAGTLIIVCSKPDGEHPDWDCCLAAENLMLAALEMGLGTCPIGLAWPALDLPEIKKELGIPSGYEAVLPIIVGVPTELPPSHGRKPAEILSWKRPDPAS